MSILSKLRKSKIELPEPETKTPVYKKAPIPKATVPEEPVKKTKAKVDDSEWRKEWVDMPEFTQEKQEPFSKIIVRFETEEDLNEFSELIGQKLTPKTKSIWHPKLIRGEHSHLVWVDENDAQ